MAPPFVIGFTGPSGVGKTTLVTRLIDLLTKKGLRVGALKHDAHGFQMDREGKDTFRFREAGAEAVGIASATARAVIVTTGRPSSLGELVAMLPGDLDLILVEGYRGEDFPKIEVHRQGAPLRCRTGVSGVIAVVTDVTDEASIALPEGVVRFTHDDGAAVAAFVVDLRSRR